MDEFEPVIRRRTVRAESLVGAVFFEVEDGSVLAQWLEELNSSDPVIINPDAPRSAWARTVGRGAS